MTNTHSCSLFTLEWISPTNGVQGYIWLREVSLQSCTNLEVVCQMTWLFGAELRAQKLQIRCLHTLQHWLFCLEKPRFRLFPLMYMKFKSAKVSCLVCFPLWGGTLHFEAKKDFILNSNQRMNSSRPIFVIYRPRMITFNDVVVLEELCHLTQERNPMERVV